MNMVTNKQLAKVFEQNAVALGIDATKAEDQNSDTGMSSSTDMGNVSYEVPSIHPFYSIGTGAYSHTRGFRDDAGMSIPLYTMYQI